MKRRCAGMMVDRRGELTATVCRRASSGRSVFSMALVMWRALEEDTEGGLRVDPLSISFSLARSLYIYTYIYIYTL